MTKESQLCSYGSKVHRSTRVALSVAINCSYHKCRACCLVETNAIVGAHDGKEQGVLVFNSILSIAKIKQNLVFFNIYKKWLTEIKEPSISPYFIFVYLCECIR